MSSSKIGKLASGHSVCYLSDEENESHAKMFDGNRKHGMITLNPGGLFMPKMFLNYADKYYRFKYRPTDVLLVTFPKCGTTWTQEIIWSMIHNPNLDNSEAANAINLRVPFLEVDGIIQSSTPPSSDGVSDVMTLFQKLCPGGNPKDGIFIQIAENTPSPRVLKTHLPFSVLDPDLLNTCKVVFVARDPKDTCISFHHHCRIFQEIGFKGSIEDFVNIFMEDKVFFCPYWGTMKEGWERRNHPNMLFLYYEDMKANPMKEISKIDKFLQTNLSDSQLLNINEYTSFSQMKKRNNLISKNDNDNTFFNNDFVKEEGGFFRKGIVGDSKNVLGKDQLKMLDEWTAKNTADMPGLKYATI